MKTPDTLRKVAEAASKVKLPGGIFGKTCYVLISVCAVCGAVAWAVRDLGVAYAALGVVGVIVLFGLWRMFRFAELHPEVAILEGAEFLRWREMEMSQKGKGSIRVTESEASDSSEDQLPAGESAALELPDPEVSQDAKPKRRRQNG